MNSFGFSDCYNQIKNLFFIFFIAISVLADFALTLLKTQKSVKIKQKVKKNGKMSRMCRCFSFRYREQ